MKFSGQTKDGAIDNLLRAYVSKPSNPNQVCADFDPDQANAYIEKSLPSAVRLQYETHLSGCPGCRKSVVALMRMAEADSLAAVTLVREAPRSTWLGGIREMFGVLSRPQWAMAGAAVVVLAVSLPILLQPNQNREASQTVASEPSAGAGVGVPASPAAPAANPKSIDTPHNLVATAKQPENTAGKPEVAAKESTPATSSEAVGVVAGFDAAKKTDTTKSAVDTVDQSQRKAESQVAATPPPQAGAAPGAPARSDAEQTRLQQQQRDAAQQVSEPKLAARVNEERAKEKAERAEDIAPPPAPRASDDARGRMRRPPSHALRDSNSAEAVRPEERKFSGKKFLFKDGAWTDKDFDPNKDLPIVTIIRDSNVYNEVLNKRPGLKPFLTGFQATERAIIVYKGTVYKLIPQ